MLELSLGPRNIWSIFDALESLHEDMNSLLSETVSSPQGRRARSVYPPLNVWSTDEGLVIEAEVPGVDPKDVEIAVEADELVLRGKVNCQELPPGESLLRRERPCGEFERTLALPYRVNADSVKATCKNGILRIALPRSEEEKPRKIAIEAS